MIAWRDWLRALAEVLFPNACPGCDRTRVLDGAVWCPECTARLLAETRDDYCPRCGQTVSPYLAQPAGCRGCREQGTPLDGLARVGPYGGLLGELIRKYKYDRRQDLDRPLGTLLASALQGRDWRGELDGLVPVPITWQSRWEYRFHPASMMAVEAGRILSLPVLDMLRVRGKRRKQTELPHSQRAANVRGVFHVRRHARLQGTTLCVIDDVCTSGSTLREIARTLKRAGAARVYGAVLAKTEPLDLASLPRA